MARLCLITMFATAPPAPAFAQSGGFVATLGSDTVHIERFTRTANRLEGIILTRTPATRRVRWSLTLDRDGRPLRYELETLRADGSPLRFNGSAGSIDYTSDGVVRAAYRDGRMDTTRIASPVTPLPTAFIPYIGTSFLMYEIAFADARRRAAAAPDSVVYFVTMMPTHTRPEPRQVWLVGPDSAEMSYFGLAKSGYRFDAAGRLLRSDWTGTTYRYRIERIAPPDIEALAQAWHASDQRGKAMGPLSPRDTARATVGAAKITVDYSRPARRGRTIWGDVVPWDRVWRLGADVATHLHTSANLFLGERLIPAGSYTLWLLPSSEDRAWLIVNSRTRIFGTNYDPARDLVRVPLERTPLSEPVERLTIAIEDGRFGIRWGDIAWSAPAADRSHAWPAAVDSTIAASWFAEANALCRRDDGRMWGLSLCGPMAVADAATRTRATSEPPPAVPQPAALGFANAAVPWGETRWMILVWSYMPQDERMRARLLVHELFHRIQPQLGLFVADSPNVHLDTPDGRYWLQLEWRALARALVATGDARASALRDALGFRAARRARFAGAAAAERTLETQEGLAQYTGTVLAAPGRADAIVDAVMQLEQAPVYNESFVRTFAYPSGAAYGLLLDDAAPGWNRRFEANDDLGDLIAAAYGVQAVARPDSASARYGGAELRAAEERREQERLERVAGLRRRFVEGPVLVLPNGRNNSFTTNGMTPIPDAGTIYPSFRSTGEWGNVSAAQILLSLDQQSLTLPAPASVGGNVIRGDGWTLELASGWTVRPGRRAGDYQVVRGSGS